MRYGLIIIVVFLTSCISKISKNNDVKLNLDISDSDVSAGGTVTKSALLSILNALESRNQF